MLNYGEGKRYATSYALKAPELQSGVTIKKFTRFTPKDITNILGVNHRDLMGRMFRYLLYLIITDIIENQIVFKLPPCGQRTWIQMDPVSGDDFVKARQNGAFDDIDYLASNFTGYQIYLTYKTRYGAWKKRIHVNKKYKDRITELTNKGVGW